jgi:hypothetical protein
MPRCWWSRAGGPPAGLRPRTGGTEAARVGGGQGQRTGGEPPWCGRRKTRGLPAADGQRWGGGTGGIWLGRRRRPWLERRRPWLGRDGGGGPGLAASLLGGGAVLGEPWWRWGLTAARGPWGSRGGDRDLGGGSRAVGLG